MFIATLFTIAKTRQQPKCSSLMGRQRNVVQIYNGIILHHKKKNEIMSFAAMWMDLEVLIISEVSQKEKNK